MTNAMRQIVGGNVIGKVEGVEQGGLLSPLASHHRKDSVQSMGDLEACRL
jgi:hypothetical protein